MKNRVYLKYAERPTQDIVDALINQILSAKSYGRVIIKPNLCFAEKIPGATTDPVLLSQVVNYFASRSDEVLVVESGALLNTADEAFDNLGIREAVEQQGGQVVNLSKHLPFEYLSYLLRHDLFVNMPVLKTHEFSVVTGAVKNMFGMIPDERRIKYHPILAQVLTQLCKAYDNQLVIMDGITGMEGHGPTRGRSVKTNVLIGGTNPAAVDRVACQIMKIPLAEAPMLEYVCERVNPEGVEIVSDDNLTVDDFAREFEIPHLDPVTASKIWIWKHRKLNNLFFVSSRIYPVIRTLGLPVRRVIRFLLRMDRID